MARYHLSSIKRRHSYTTEEIGALLGIDRKTVQRWTKEGLQPIVPNRKPLLFQGQALHDFLKQRRADRQVELKEDEFYCLACRKAVKAKEGTQHTEKTGKKVGKDNREQYRKSGRCEECGRNISRLLQTSPKETK